MRTMYDDIVNPLEAGFLESDGFNIAVYSKHGDYIVETDIPLEPIWIPGTWLNASQWQIASLPHRSKNIMRIFSYLINAGNLARHFRTPSRTSLNVSTLTQREMIGELCESKLFRGWSP